MPFSRSWESARASSPASCVAARCNAAGAQAIGAELALTSITSDRGRQRGDLVLAGHGAGDGWMAIRPDNRGLPRAARATGPRGPSYRPGSTRGSLLGATKPHRRGPGWFWRIGGEPRCVFGFIADARVQREPTTLPDGASPHFDIRLSCLLTPVDDRGEDRRSRIVSSFAAGWRRASLVEGKDQPH